MADQFNDTIAILAMTLASLVVLAGFAVLYMRLDKAKEREDAESLAAGYDAQAEDWDKRAGLWRQRGDATLAATCERRASRAREHAAKLRAEGIS